MKKYKSYPFSPIGIHLQVSFVTQMPINILFFSDFSKHALMERQIVETMTVVFILYKCQRQTMLLKNCSFSASN